MLFSNSKNGRRNSGSKEFIRSLASDRFPTFAVKRIFPTLSALLPGKVIGTFGNPSHAWPGSPSPRLSRLISAATSSERSSLVVLPARISSFFIANGSTPSGLGLGCTCSLADDLIGLSSVVKLEDPDDDLLEGFALLFLIPSDPEPLPTSEPTLFEPELSTTMEPVPEPSSEPSPEPVPTPEPQPSEPEPDPPQLEPVIEPSTEHELEPVDSDSESEPDVGLMLLFSKAVVRALPAPSLSPDDPSDPVVDMVHQGQEFAPSEFIEPISGPSPNLTVHQITEESASGYEPDPHTFELMEVEDEEMIEEDTPQEILKSLERHEDKPQPVVTLCKPLNPVWYRKRSCLLTGARLDVLTLNPPISMYLTSRASLALFLAVLLVKQLKPESTPTVPLTEHSDRPGPKTSKVLKANPPLVDVPRSPSLFRASALYVRQSGVVRPSSFKAQIDGTRDMISDPASTTESTPVLPATAQPVASVPVEGMTPQTVPLSYFLQLKESPRSHQDVWQFSGSTVPFFTTACITQPEPDHSSYKSALPARIPARIPCHQHRRISYQDRKSRLPYLLISKSEATYLYLRGNRLASPLLLASVTPFVPPLQLDCLLTSGKKIPRISYGFTPCRLQLRDAKVSYKSCPSHRGIGRTTSIGYRYLAGLYLGYESYLYSSRFTCSFLYWIGSIEGTPVLDLSAGSSFDQVSNFLSLEAGDTNSELNYSYLAGFFLTYVIPAFKLSYNPIYAHSPPIYTFGLFRLT
ncbi:hypothetical protein Acr_00g0104620 [Actinidia rufa]|uniref:Uncharacterized protein n=1 Tax=Actinidia rufa TaxID=165716 RepID=A0A7J0E3D5_9ERIC|nr:hypothetical protein Acr_00g0104620 [Actinidia rufa]